MDVILELFPNFDLFLQGHAGSSVRVNRSSRSPVSMQSPALGAWAILPIGCIAGFDSESRLPGVRIIRTISVCVAAFKFRLSHTRYKTNASFETAIAILKIWIEGRISRSRPRLHYR